MYNAVQRSLLKSVGWMRLYLFSFCPQCNSDAPELYDCKICKSYSSANGDKWPPSTKLKNRWWKNFVRSLYFY